ncbi:HNH endonuclease [Burkholderia ambifaria]|uniref:HNH endonuclease n=1 Tax=Burkholderia ambifaria TaxID=152480 RepID=UPI0019D1079A|nr:HNH endonuclease [Burkholderia ambifaria]
MAKRDQVMEAVRAIGRPCTVAEMTAWLTRHRPGVWTDVANILSSLTVNDDNRHLHDRGRRDFTLDPNHPKDLLIKTSVRGGRDVRYWLYDFATERGAPYASDADLGLSGDVAATRLDFDSRYWLVLEAVRALGKPCTVREITIWLNRHHAHVRHPDVRQNAGMLCVNEPNRAQFDAGRKSYRSDRGHPKDVLFRQGNRSTGVTYELYDPAQHGVWDLQPSSAGKWEAVRLNIGLAEQALMEARAHVYGNPLPDFASEPEAHRYVMRAIAMREGQPKFRAALMEAYAGRCAVTGCAVEAILEGAHIRPYAAGGATTNVVNNGMLLRADIHTLFDRGLLWVDCNGHIQLARELHSSEYVIFRGQPVRLPQHECDHPHPSHLTHHRVHTARQPE